MIEGSQEGLSQALCPPVHTLYREIGIVRNQSSQTHAMLMP